MNQMRDPDAIIAAWLEDGPTDLSADTRRAIVTGMRVMSRRRPGPVFGGTPMPTFMRLAAAAFVVVIAAISLSILVPRGSTQPGGVASPTASPAASPFASPSLDPRTPSPLDGVATAFPHPFRYHLLESAGLVLSISDPTFYQFRVPKPGTDSWGNAIIVRLISGGRADPCKETSASVSLTGGPGAVFDYLKTIRQLTVSNQLAQTVSGLPAMRAAIEPTEPTADCPDLWLWADEGSFTQNAGWDASSEFTVVDVDGDHVVIFANGDVAWQTAAHQFIDSIHFE
jgi:hypothetical protein